MSLKFRDRVYEQTNLIGTGDALLLGAVVGYQGFSSFGDGNQAYYVIAHQAANQWEVGLGTVHVTAGVATLSRTTVLRSSNADAQVNFNVIGKKEVRCPLPADLCTWLTDPSTLIHADGSVAFTANQSMGGHHLTNVADPAAGTDAANKEYVDAQDASVISTVEAWVTAHFGAGNVTVTNPTTVHDVPAWDNASGDLRPSSNVQIDSGNSDKLVYWASVGAFDTAVDGATINFDFNLASNWQATLGGDRALAFSNASIGQIVTLILWQDGTGDRTPTWWTNIDWDKGLAPIIDPTPGGWLAVRLLCVGTISGVPLWIELCRSVSAPRKGITTATDGATVTFDTRLSPLQKVTLGGNRTLALNSKGLYVGFRFTIELIQDATGGRTVTWWSTITWPGGTVPTLTTTANKKDRFAFIVTAVGGSPAYEGYVIGQGL